MRSNKSILKEINPEYSLEGLILKLKLQYFDHLMWRADSFEKTDVGKDWRQEEKGTTEDEMVRWHHWLIGRGSEQVPRDGEGQGSLARCSPRGCKETDMTEQLNWTEYLQRSKKKFSTVGQSNYMRDHIKDILWYSKIHKIYFLYILAYKVIC